MDDLLRNAVCQKYTLQRLESLNVSSFIEDIEKLFNYKKGTRSILLHRGKTTKLSKIVLIMQKLFQSTERKVPNCFYEASRMLVCKPDKANRCRKLLTSSTYEY